MLTSGLKTGDTFLWIYIGIPVAAGVWFSVTFFTGDFIALFTGLFDRGLFAPGLLERLLYSSSSIRGSVNEMGSS